MFVWTWSPEEELQQEEQLDQNITTLSFHPHQFHSTTALTSALLLCGLTMVWWALASMAVPTVYSSEGVVQTWQAREHYIVCVYTATMYGNLNNMVTWEMFDFLWSFLQFRHHPHFFSGFLWPMYSLVDGYIPQQLLVTRGIEQRIPSYLNHIHQAVDALYWSQYWEWLLV